MSDFAPTSGVGITGAATGLSGEVFWMSWSIANTGCAGSAIEVAPANSNFVYVGTEKGGFYRSLDGAIKRFAQALALSLQIDEGDRCHGSLLSSTDSARKYEILQKTAIAQGFSGW